jgi:glycerophosphoryl diester phosphodiesterase
VTKVFAHRGAHLVARENTLASFEDAKALGVDGVELDVRRTADGVLVVHHDPMAQGTWIAHARASELPDYVPRLEEALEALRGLQVNVEVKNAKEEGDGYDESGSFVRQVLDYLHQGGLGASAGLSCFDLDTCATARAYDPDLDLALLIWLSSPEEALREAANLGLNAVNPHFRLVSAASSQLANELGLALNVWTVNEPDDLVAMAELGVASIITDQPARALELFAQRTD